MLDEVMTNETTTASDDKFSKRNVPRYDGNFVGCLLFLRNGQLSLNLECFFIKKNLN